MSALNQYIDLFDRHRGLIEANSSPVMNAVRDKALEGLKVMTLPAKGSEHHAITDFESLLAPDYGINLAKVNIDVNPSDTFHCGVPHLSTSLFFLINDTYAESADCLDGLPEGVVAGSLRRFCIEHPDVAARHYDKLTSDSNPVDSLNSLLAEDGFVVWVKEGVIIDKPLQLVNILENHAPLMAVRRILVILEPRSEARLLMCDHTQNPDTDFLSLQTIEIFAGEDSRFDIYDLEESSERTVRLSSLHVEQKRGSEVLVDGITLFNGFTRNEYRCVHTEEGSTLRLLGMGIEDMERKVETYSRVEHLAGHCRTDELFKYVVDDNAQGSFEGMVYVAPGAVKTEAYQSNRNIVGDDSARMFSRPQLEIYNDDVKCSHGSATGQLDRMQVFYMRTRGLTEDMAKLLLKQAFMADVIEGVRIPHLRDRLHIMVERRFAGEKGACASCSSCGDFTDSTCPSAQDK